jgi:hypothetical protein
MPKTTSKKRNASVSCGKATPGGPAEPCQTSLRTRRRAMLRNAARSAANAVACAAFICSPTARRQPSSRAAVSGAGGCSISFMSRSIPKRQSRRLGNLNGTTLRSPLPKLLSATRGKTGKAFPDSGTIARAKRMQAVLIGNPVRPFRSARLRPSRWWHWAPRVSARFLSPALTRPPRRKPLDRPPRRDRPKRHDDPSPCRSRSPGLWWKRSEMTFPDLK